MNRISMGLFALALSVPLTGNAAPSPISTTLSLDHSWFVSTGELTMDLTLENNSDESIRLLTWETPLDGITENLFEVTLDGEPVDYIGPIFKRAAPRPQDFIQIDSGESISFVVNDLGSAYDLSKPGLYEVRYDSSVLAGGRHLDLRSDTAELWLDGSELQPRRDEVTAISAGIFTACRSSQRTDLTLALSNAAMIADLSVDHLEENPSGDDLYEWWFGDYTRNRFDTVDSNFLSIADALNNENITFNCACPSPAYAYVYPNDPYEIHVCRAFWKAPDLGRDSKAGTLVHEVSHFTIVAGTDDHVYGASGAHSLAESDPSRAIDNADNHEYFAEDQAE